MLVAVGRGGCWLVAGVAVVVGVVKLRKKRCGAMQHVFLHRLLMRVLLA